MNNNGVQFLGIVLIVSSMAHAMENQPSCWIGWNHKNKVYECRAVSQEGIALRNILNQQLESVAYRRQHKSEPTNPPLTMPIAQQPKNRSHSTHCLPSVPLSLPEHQFNLLMSNLHRSMQSYRGQSYGQAFRNLRMVKALLLNCHDETKNKFKSEGQLFNSYSNFIRLDLRITALMAEHNDDQREVCAKYLSKKTQFCNLFTQILKEIYSENSQ